jgi:diguanylate cyclase (GGDEF)-like protein
MLVLEILSWVFDGQPGIWNRLFNIVFNTLFTGLSVFVVTIWALYIDYMIFGDEKQIKKNIKWYALPGIIVFILTIINAFLPFMFVIDSNNVYGRLDGIWIGAVFTYLIYGYVVYLVYTNRRRLTSNFLVGVILFLILPQLAVIAQILFLGLTVIWPVTALAVIFSYLLFETTSSSYDYLTGVYTRVYAEDYMYTLIKKHKPFTVILIDMDDFKHINDTYGHHVGDKVLIEMGRILQETFPKKEVVSRFGGDEFIVVMESTSKGNTELFRKTIYNLMRKSKHEYITQAKFSMGISICSTTHDCTIEELMIDADNNMYLDKAKNKNFKRRRNDRRQT